MAAAAPSVPLQSAVIHETAVSPDKWEPFHIPREWFTEEEWSAIDEFSRRVADVDAVPRWKSPVQLRRFLVARDMNLDKAESMYRASMAWRKKVRACLHPTNAWCAG
jgi:hypothetical protein